MPFLESIVPLTPSNPPMQRCPMRRRDAPQRILIVKYGALGDILMTMPLLTTLRGAYPDAYITWIVEHSTFNSLAANPCIDKLLVWDSSYWRDMIHLRCPKPITVTKALLAAARLLGATRT